jgi:hypothetical protein
MMAPTKAIRQLWALLITEAQISPEAAVDTNTINIEISITTHYLLLAPQGEIKRYGFFR